jgi:hypothetical protein
MGSGAIDRVRRKAAIDSPFGLRGAAFAPKSFVNARAQEFMEHLGPEDIATPEI